MINIETISQLHHYLGLPGPNHPLLSVIHQSQLTHVFEQGSQFRFGLFLISLKDGKHCSMEYGQTTYDFDTGTMTFLAPDQEITVNVIEPVKSDMGWTIAFHPDLIRLASLGSHMEQYTFFNYESHEALHLSDHEIAMVSDMAKNIETETKLNLDGHSQSLLCANIELLLKYCSRFYDRQFITRSNLNNAQLERFNQFLQGYYQTDRPQEAGIPTVQYCGQELGVSPYYLSDLLKKETGKNALEHIHLFLIERAKTQLCHSKLSITQIAYDLGFEYPQHFSKLFKAKTGLSPRTYRSNA